jgi:hypothetical protein
MHITKKLSLLLFSSLPSLVGASPTGIYNCFITYQPTHLSPDRFSDGGNSPILGITKITSTVNGESNSLHLISVNSGNSLIVQGADFPGSGICQRP